MNVRTTLWAAGGYPRIRSAQGRNLHGFPHGIHRSDTRDTLARHDPYELFHSAYHYQRFFHTDQEAVGEVDT
jgi:hypothetical protein